MNKFLLLFSLFLISSNNILCQPNIIDSLQSELDQLQEDSSKVNILNQLSKHYLNVNIDDAIEYAVKAEQLSQQIRYEDGQVEAMLNLSGVEERKGNFDEALQLSEQALKLARHSDSPRKAINALTSIGIIYYTMGDYAIAIENFLDALEAAEMLKDKELTAKLLNNVGSVYYRTGNTSRALEYYESSLPVYEKLNKINELSTLKLNIGAIHRELKNYNSSEKYLNESLNLARQAGDSLTISFALNNLSGLYFDQGDYKTALDYLLRSYRIKERLGSKADIANSLANIASLYGKLGEYEKAVDYCTRSMAIAEELKSSSLLLNSYKVLSDIYSAKEDYSNAYNYTVLYHSLKDSLDSYNNSNIAEAQAIYETNKILSENERLQLENEYRDDIIYYQRIAVFIIIVLVILISIFAVIFFRQKNKLNRLNSMKDKFFSIVAHDLKNPINTILNITQELEVDFNEISDEEKIELLGILEKSTHMLTDLITNLFTWSTFQQGFVSFNPEQYNLAAALKSTSEILKHSASSKNIKLQLECDEELFVYADKKMIDSVLINLISNAVKFTPDSGSITVSAIVKDSKAEIAVKDTGVGIPEEAQESLFKIETNISTKGTDGEQGTGLGLLICKEFVELNKGTIWLDSEVDKGSTIFVTLPIA